MEKMSKIERLEQKLAKARHDAAVRARIRPLRLAMKRLDVDAVNEQDRDVVLQCADMLHARVVAIEGATEDTSA